MDIFDLHRLVLSSAQYTDWISKYMDTIGKTYGSNITFFNFNNEGLYIDLTATGIEYNTLVSFLMNSYIDAVESTIVEGVPNHIFFSTDKATALLAHQIINTNRMAFRKMCERTLTIINFSVDQETIKLRINFHN